MNFAICLSDDEDSSVRPVHATPYALPQPNQNPSLFWEECGNAGPSSQTLVEEERHGLLDDSGSFTSQLSQTDCITFTSSLPAQDAGVRARDPYANCDNLENNENSNVYRSPATGPRSSGVSECSQASALEEQQHNLFEDKPQQSQPRKSKEVKFPLLRHLGQEELPPNVFQDRNSSPPVMFDLTVRPEHFIEHVRHVIKVLLHEQDPTRNDSQQLTNEPVTKQTSNTEPGIVKSIKSTNSILVNDQIKLEIVEMNHNNQHCRFTMLQRKKKNAVKYFKQRLVDLNVLPDNKIAPSVGPIENIFPFDKNLVKVAEIKPNGPIYYRCEHEVLGKGAYGSVYKGYAIKGKEKHPVAVKIVNNSSIRQYKMDKELGSVPSEVYFLKLMQNCKHVIKFLHYEQVSTDEFAIITEMPENYVDMFELQKHKPYPLTEDEARNVTRQLVGVAREMEKKGFAHRDIKLENILYNINTGDIKVIDFGLSRSHKPGELIKDFAGTEMNVPPEYILNHEYALDKETVRSIGMVLYQILHGYCPNYVSAYDITMRLPTFNTSLTNEVKDLMTGLFALDPNQRRCLKEVKRHPWVDGHRPSIGSRILSRVRRLFQRGQK